MLCCAKSYYWLKELKLTHDTIQFSSVQSLSRVQLFATPWITARQASLSITNSRSLLKLMSIESVMPSSHLILCRPLLLLPPIPPSIRVSSQWVNSSYTYPNCKQFSMIILSLGAMQKGKMVVWGGLTNVKRREVKSKGEKERHSHLKAEFQRIARRDKKPSSAINAKK